MTSVQILRHTNEFQQFCTKTNEQMVQNIERWRKPPADYLKLNFDGAFFQQTKTGGWGFVIRDSEGDHVGSGAGHIAAVTEASHAEGIACIHAIQFAVDAGIHKVELETDCLTMKVALSSNIYDDAQGGSLFREIKILLGINFIDFRIVHASRVCNNVAHSLATLGSKLNVGSMVIWHDDEVPEDVISLLAADLVPAPV
jgi:hypothetical protein